MITRYKSEEFPNVFIQSYEIDMDADLSTENGITTFDNNAKDNPHPNYRYLVRVGGGYRAFTKKSHATTYNNEG
jgi:predicted extracellular nuclease